MRKLFLSSILALYSASAAAVTLEQALTSGYNNDEELKNIRVEFLNEIEKFPRALAGFMPKVSVGMDATNSKTTSRSSLAGADAINNNGQRYNRTITLEQPIFDGGSSVAELKAAQSAFRAARGSYYDQEQDAFLKEIEAYLNCVEAKEKYDISKVSVRSNKTQVEAMQEKFKLGESTATEVYSAKEGLATAEANQAVAYANVEASKANFYSTFGIEAVDVTMPSLPGDLPPSLAILIERATAVNPAIEQARHTTKALKAEECGAKGALLPRVSVKVENGQTSYDPQNPQNNQYNNKSITSTLSVRVPILEKGGIEYSDVRRAKYKTRKAVINLDSQIKQIQANSKASWAGLDAAKWRIDATEQAVKAAEVAYEGMIQEEMLGSKTILEVLTAEERLNKAREVRVEAKKSMVIAAYKIKALVGELTAKSMALKVEYFNPESEFKKIKMQIVGF